MDTSPPQDSHLRHCPKCNHDLPATLEYFGRSSTSKDGFQVYCKSCRHDMSVSKAARDPNWHKERYQRQRARELAKSPEEQEENRKRKAKRTRESRAGRRQVVTCISCRTRPASFDRFCEECWQWRQDNPHIKHCPTCNRDLPATSEYFHHNGGGKRGFRLPCKSCRHDGSIAMAASNPDLHKEQYKKRRARELAKSTNEQEKGRKRKLETSRKLYQKKKRQGMCSVCLVNPVEPGRLCEQCYEKQKQWREDNPDLVKANRRQARHKLRDQIFSAYGGKCICCGESNYAFLAIDHVNGGGQKHFRSLGISGGYDFWSWLRKNDFPQDEFQVLCHNCNHAKYAYDICPHQRETPYLPKTSDRRCKIKLRDQIFTVYDSKCACCGEKRPEFLSIDHVNNDGSEHRRTIGRTGGAAFWRWLRDNGFPKEGFQVLCYNCNRAKYGYGVCPHQNKAPSGP